MDWFLYGNGLRHERVITRLRLTHNKSRKIIAFSEDSVSMISFQVKCFEITTHTVTSTK